MCYDIIHYSNILSYHVITYMAPGVVVIIIVIMTISVICCYCYYDDY